MIRRPPRSTLFPTRRSSDLLDLAAAALLEDLSQRGSLDSTIVLVIGEFGRTPKVNANAGRHHWPRSEEHTSELQYGYISYAVFCLKKRQTKHTLAPRNANVG